MQNNISFAGTPSASTPELLEYYENLKKFYQEILYHISELEKLPTSNQAELRDIKDKISRNLIEVAISSLHCGSRWVSQANESISDLKGEPESLELMLDRLFIGMRTLLAEKIGSSFGSDSHSVNVVTNLLSPKVGLPSAGKIIETFGLFALIKENEVFKRFYNLYTPKEMLTYLIEHMSQKPRLKEAVLEWFRDNPGEFKKEYYTNLKKELETDAALATLLQPVSIDYEIKTAELKKFVDAVNEHKFSESLPEMLIELRKVKPDEYALELAYILKQEFKDAFNDKTLPRKDETLPRIMTFLSVNKSFQTAFYQYLASSQAKSEGEPSLAIQKLTGIIQKIDQANSLIAYLKSKDVTLDHETALSMIGHKTPFTVLEGVLDKRWGNEFVDTIYTSLGMKLIEAMPDLMENEVFTGQVNQAATHEQQLAVLQTLWKLVFNEQHAEELQSLLKTIKYEPELLKQIIQALRLPCNENLETCKKALLAEPFLQYQFDQQQLVRLLLEQQFLQRR